MTADLLNHRSWHQLRAVARALGLPFNNNLSHRQARTVLRTSMLDGLLKRTVRRLSAAEREPLLALQLADGIMPLYLFSARFGTIRPFRPWRRDGVRQPWKSPVSLAEKLWFWGVVEIIRGKSGHPDLVLLPDEVALLLPPRPLPQPVVKQRRSVLTRSANTLVQDTLARDLAAMLAGIQAGEAHLRRGDWLTPRALRMLNRRLVDQVLLDDVRSERASGRLSFLHYVLRVTGLMSSGTACDEWLADPNPVLIELAIQQDLHARDPLWRRFGLPPVSLKAWLQIQRTVQDLEPGVYYSYASLQHLLRFTLPQADLDALMRTVCRWIGWIDFADDETIVRRAPAGPGKPAQIVCHPEMRFIDLCLPDQPFLAPFVAVGRWAQVVAADHLRITPDTIRNALEQGEDLSGMITALTDLGAAPLSWQTLNCLQEWARQAQALTLHTMTILTAADSSTLAAIRSDWRLRPMLGASLSAHHLVVKADQVPLLQRKLMRRGYPVTTFSPSEHSVSHLPQTTQRLRYTGRGEIQQQDQACIETAVQAALQAQTAITIQYYSPHSGETSVRTIEPVLRYERAGAAYVEAWCRLDRDNRTFRLDRILAVMEYD